MRKKVIAFDRLLDKEVVVFLAGWKSVRDGGYVSVVDHLLTMYEALGLIPALPNK